jgi:hypothetical protein
MGRKIKDPWLTWITWLTWPFSFDKYSLTYTHRNILENTNTYASVLFLMDQKFLEEIFYDYRRFSDVPLAHILCEVTILFHISSTMNTKFATFLYFFLCMSLQLNRIPERRDFMFVGATVSEN